MFVCRPLNTAKYVVSFDNCWKLLLNVFHIGGILTDFAGFGGKPPVVGFLIKQIFKRRLQCRCFSVDCSYFWEHLPCRVQTTVSILFLIHYYHLIFHLGYAEPGLRRFFIWQVNFIFCFCWQQNKAIFYSFTVYWDKTYKRCISWMY